jgi:hypothetical protein
MSELPQAIILNPDVIFTDVGNKEAVLLHLGTKKYYSLNETGVYIWKMLESGLTPENVTQKLQNEFEISPSKAIESVLTLLNDLVSEKLVETSGG